MSYSDFCDSKSRTECRTECRTEYPTESPTESYKQSCIEHGKIIKKRPIEDEDCCCGDEGCFTLDDYDAVKRQKREEQEKKWIESYEEAVREYIKLREDTRKIIERSIELDDKKVRNLVSERLLDKYYINRNMIKDVTFKDEDNNLKKMINDNINKAKFAAWKRYVSNVSIFQLNHFVFDILERDEHFGEEGSFSTEFIDILKKF